MRPSCVEVTPKLTTCAIEVDSAAGLKQPRERSIMTRCAQKSLRVVDYQYVQHIQHHLRRANSLHHISAYVGYSCQVLAI